MLDKVEKSFSALIRHYKQKRFLIAASGGLDSTVLIHLCKQLDLDFAICHCNFQLRGEESDADQEFLEDLAKELKVTIYVKSKNAKTHADAKSIGIQEAARQIRYNWFADCLKIHAYDFVLTAHHANDNIETYLINSFRGTGIRGLTGIPKQRDYILRPLLDLTRAELLHYAKTNSHTWREDSSNESDKYLRNVIRHHLIPFFDDKADDMFARFNTTLKHLYRQDRLLKDYLDFVKNKIFIQTKPTLQISIDRLLELPNYTELLEEIFKAYGFTDFVSVSNLIEAQNGKTVYAEDYQIVKERGFLELSKFETGNDETIHINLSALPLKIEFEKGVLEFSDQENFIKTNVDIAFLNKDKLSQKLVLRKLRKGDYFYPLGMKGKRKLSDFLKDEKLTNFAKSKTWVLAHGEDIIWVINHRIDNRYKVTKTTDSCLRVVFKAY